MGIPLLSDFGPAEMLKFWYRGCWGHVHVCSKGNFGGDFKLLDLGAYQEFELEEIRGYPDVYMSTCTLKGPKRKRQNVHQVPGLWVDLDFKRFAGGQLEAERRLTLFPHEPSLIVQSGNGYHVYWKFSSPQEPSDDVLFLLKHATALVGSDPAAGHFAALLRIPGTANSKYPLGKYHSPKAEREMFAKVTIDQRSTGKYHSCEEMQSEVKDSAVKARIASHSSLSLQFDHHSFPEPLPDIPRKFRNLLRRSGKLRRTWKGSRPDLQDQSRSGYDMSMTWQLAYRGYTNQEIVTVLRAMPSGRGKEGTIPYFMYGIQKVRQRMKEEA